VRAPERRTPVPATNPPAPRPVAGAALRIAAPPVSTRPEARGTRTAGAFLLSLYLLIFFSRVLDVFSPVQVLHIPMILLGAVMCFAFLEGGIFRAFATQTGKANLLFVAWICVAFAFSSWKSGGLDTLQSVLQSALLFLAINALLRDFGKWMLAAKMLAWSGLISALLSFYAGKVVQGRVSVEIGTLADPNEYALILLMTAPFLWLIARNSPTPKLAGAFGILCSIPMFIAFVRAGSRGGELAAAVLLLAIFIKVPMIQKLKLAVASIVISICVLAMLPSYLLTRYMTLFTMQTENLDGGEAEALKSDVDSATARRAVLFSSIDLTATHPLFGVGPGVFPAANWDTGLKLRQRRGWTMSHNSYTQVSSETGIPGLILFLASLWFCIRSAWRISKYAAENPALRPLSSAAECLMAAMIAFCVGAFFLSVAYSPLVMSLLGMGSALEQIARKQMAASRRSPERAERSSDPAFAQGLRISP
jgi:O-antigen ligase